MIYVVVFIGLFTEVVDWNEYCLSRPLMTLQSCLLMTHHLPLQHQRERWRTAFKFTCLGYRGGVCLIITWSLQLPDKIQIAGNVSREAIHRSLTCEAWSPNDKLTRNADKTKVHRLRRLQGVAALVYQHCGCFASLADAAAALHKSQFADAELALWTIF